MRWLLKLLGPALLIVLVTNTDTDAIVSALKGVDPLRFLQATGCWVAIAAIKAWRWQLLLAGQSIPLPYTQALQWYLAGLFLGGISPGRLGELIKVSFVRDLGHPMGRALFSSVLDRLFDLIVLPLVVLAGMALYGAAFVSEMESVAIGLGLIALSALLLWRARRLLRRALSLPIRVLMPKEMQHEAKMSVDDFFEEFKTLGLREWSLHGALTALCWIAYGGAAVLLTMGLGVEVSPLWTGVAVLCAALAGLIPITVSGIGTRDAVLVAFFSRVGASNSAAIALSTLLLGLNLVVIVLYWPAYQLSLTKGHEDE